jgi:hypothetical protein
VLFECKRDAERFLSILPKRFGEYGLTLHPDKTRLVPFLRPDQAVDADEDDQPGTFDLLGFTHFWGPTRKGGWIVKQWTAKDRFRRALHRLRQWCQRNMHLPLKEQHRGLKQKLNGHYAYYGITSNSRRIRIFCWQAGRVWYSALKRRSQKGLTWERMNALLKRFPLPAPHIIHRYGT